MSLLASPGLVFFRSYTTTAPFLILTFRVVSGLFCSACGVLASISILRTFPLSVHRVSSWWRVTVVLLFATSLSLTLSIFLLGYVVNVARGFFLLACLQCIHFLLFLYRFSSFYANHQLAPFWGAFLLLCVVSLVCGVLMCMWTSVLVSGFLARCVGILAPVLSSCPRCRLLVCILPVLGESFACLGPFWSWSLPAGSCSSSSGLSALCMRTVRIVGFWLPLLVCRSLL